MFTCLFACLLAYRTEKSNTFIFQHWEQGQWWKIKLFFFLDAPCDRAWLCWAGRDRSKAVNAAVVCPRPVAAHGASSQRTQVYSLGPWPRQCSPMLPTHCLCKCEGRTREQTIGCACTRPSRPLRAVGSVVRLISEDVLHDVGAFRGRSFQTTFTAWRNM